MCLGRRYIQLEAAEAPLGHSSCPASLLCSSLCMLTAALPLEACTLSAMALQPRSALFCPVAMSLLHTQQQHLTFRMIRHRCYMLHSMHIITITD